MKNPEKNATAKIGYAITMLVTSAILICMKKYQK